MCDTVKQGIDMLNFTSKVLGSIDTIYINSGIFQHCDLFEKSFDLNEDLYEIKASLYNPITMDKILNVFKLIQLQFNKTPIKDGLTAPDDRSYYYKGFTYDVELGTWCIHWVHN
jgi:hypothetical protein